MIFEFIVDGKRIENSSDLGDYTIKLTVGENEINCKNSSDSVTYQYSLITKDDLAVNWYDKVVPNGEYKLNTVKVTK